MTPLTKEWVDKAEGDFTSLLRELRARKSPNMMELASTLNNAPRNTSKPD